MLAGYAKETKWFTRTRRNGTKYKGVHHTPDIDLWELLLACSI